MSRRTSLFAKAALVVGGLVLFLFDPASSPLFPPCLFQLSTGLTCPGCGGLRAMHQLLHGDFATAFAFNPLLVLALPVAVTLEGWRRVSRRPFDLPPAAGAIVVVALVTFWILRNIPGVDLPVR